MASNTMSALSESAPALYKRLAKEKLEIRLLELHTSDGPHESIVPLAYKLKTVSLHDNPRYDAISYVWGEVKDFKPIIVEGHELLISSNLYAALETFSSMQKLRKEPMWADQVCINQLDLDERSAQVAIMGTIYHNALIVRIYLCPRSEATDRAIAILGSMVSDGLEPSATSDALIHPGLKKDLRRLSDNDFAAVRELYLHAWWTRLWTLQEAGLARGPILFMGESMVNFRALLHLTEGILRSSLEPVAHSLEKQKLFESLNAISQAMVPHIHVLVMIKGCNNDPARILGRDLTILFANIGNLGALRSHDYVFALLGILPAHLNITPDYLQEVEELFTETTRRIIDKTRLLDILTIAGPLEDVTQVPSDVTSSEPCAPDVLPTWKLDPRRLLLPSWVVNFRKAKPRSKQARPGELYNACDGLPALRGSAVNGKLEVSALYIGIMETVNAASLNMWDSGEATKAVLRKWSELASSQEGIVRSKIGFWNTVLHGAIRESDPATNVLMTEEESNLMSSSCEEWLRTDSTQSTSPRLAALNSIYAPNRRTHFFKLDSHHFGTAQDVRLGDVVVILAGLDYPAVVRSVGANQYKFVGCCFIDAIMGGEAVQAGRSSDAESDGLPDGFKTIVLV